VNAVRIPSLDGFRAVSIVLVLLAHLNGTGYGPDLRLVETLDLGSLGVRIFFVISGFLVTTLLELECERNGGISIRGFLRRRAFRILPAFTIYVAAMAALNASGMIGLHQSDVLTASTFTMNYHGDRSWYLGHLWSLSVEAQFYVCWAALRVFAGRSRMFWIAVAALAVGPAARVGTYVMVPEWRWSIGEAFPTIVDALATGSLLAMLQGRLSSSAAYVAFLRSRLASAAVPISLVALGATLPHIAFSYTVGQTLMNLLIALMIHRTVVFSEGLAGRVLNARAAVALGTVSYSLYLWQQPFLNRESASVFAQFPVNFALAIAAGLLSYSLIERPALAAGRRMTARRPRPAASHANGLDAHAATI
jgi:peptidoglycan/LPS O-acetylase OafA/YrhL